MKEDINRLIKTTQFPYLWISQLFSQLTIQIVNFLLLISLFEKTGSTVATSFLWIILAFPAILVGPFTAAFADMADKRAMLMYANLIQAITIFVFSFFFERYLYLTYAAALFYSMVNQFYVPAEAASLPVLVPKKNLPFANGLFFLTQQASIIVGAGTAGILADLVGFEIALRITSVFLLIGFVSVSFLPRLGGKAASIHFFEVGITKFYRRITEGYHYIKNNNFVKFPFLLLLGLQVAIAVLVINLPTFATEVIQISPRYAGAMVVVPAAVGAVYGTTFVTKSLKKGTRKKGIIERSLVSMSAALFLVAFIPHSIPHFFRVVVAVLCFALAGYSYVGVSIPSQTFLQESTSRKFMGRVFGNFWFLASVALVLPVLFSATITEVLGVRMFLVTLSLLTFLVFFVSRKYGEMALISKEANEQI